MKIIFPGELLTQNLGSTSTITVTDFSSQDISEIALTIKFTSGAFALHLIPGEPVAFHFISWLSHYLSWICVTFYLFKENYTKDVTASSPERSTLPEFTNTGNDSNDRTLLLVFCPICINILYKRHITRL